MRSASRQRAKPGLDGSSQIEFSKMSARWYVVQPCVVYYWNDACRLQEATRRNSGWPRNVASVESANRQLIVAYSDYGRFEIARMVYWTPTSAVSIFGDLQLRAGNKAWRSSMKTCARKSNGPRSYCAKPRRVRRGRLAGGRSRTRPTLTNWSTSRHHSRRSSSGSVKSLTCRGKSNRRAQPANLVDGGRHHVHRRCFVTSRLRFDRTRRLPRLMYASTFRLVTSTPTRVTSRHGNWCRTQRWCASASPPEIQPQLATPSAIDWLESFLVDVFLRRYVTCCARRSRYAHERRGAAALNAARVADPTPRRLSIHLVPRTNNDCPLYMAAIGGGFNPSTQQLHEIVVLAFRSAASFSAVRW